MRMILSTCFCLLVSSLLLAQPAGNLMGGPMPGNVEMRTAQVWAEVKPGTAATLEFWEKANPKMRKKAFVTYNDVYDFRTVKFDLVALAPGTAYEYALTVPPATGKANVVIPGAFTTKVNWWYREKLPDFSFLTGSCSYFNDPASDRIFSDFIKLDRPASPYGGDSSIFETMARTPANFMMWLGDNWYTREVDYYSEWGLQNRASVTRAAPVLQNFLKAMPHYGVWDDHDFGPNDCDKSYSLKEASRKVFMNYWLNPSYGEDGKGVYTRFMYSDAEFFLLDDRTFRSSDNMADSLNGFPNPEKRMFGPMQMDWLRNALLGSKANFKIIVTGSQVLNPVSPFDCFRKFPAEYMELMEFLKIEKINGVLFLTGDRHHTEIIKVDRSGTYPLYDITCSPLTSGTHKFGGAEKNNPYRVLGIDEKQNFGKFSFSGEPGNRKLTIEFLGTTGDKLGEWSVIANQLKQNNAGR
jgi:alkaline phosphatase D